MRNIMTPKEKRNDMLGERMVKNLERRHFEAYYCRTSAEAIDKVQELIPDGSSVTWGGSMTIRDMGLTKALHERAEGKPKAKGSELPTFKNSTNGCRPNSLEDCQVQTSLSNSQLPTLKIYDRDLVSTVDEAQEIYRKAFWCDYYLSSANAISEDGVIVNIDGNGNRVAAITFGPKHVIFVIGLNKVSPDVQSALARARSTASPINMARFDRNTPCSKDGMCHNCSSAESICNYFHFIRQSYPVQRHIVVLVGEDLGY